MGETQSIIVTLLFWVFLGVVEAIVSLLLCCGVDIVQCPWCRPQHQETTTFFRLYERKR